MSNAPKKDDASTGGGIGDIPAQPVNPATPHSGDTDPRFAGDGVDAHTPTDEEIEETEGQPT